MIFSNEGLKPLSKASFDPSQLASASDKSAPDEKALPDPERTTTLILSSSFTSLVASCKSQIN